MLIVLAATLLGSLGACGREASLGDAGSSGEDRPFSELAGAARGTTVNFSMYGGDEDINAYVDDYVAPNLKEKFDITLKRIALPDAAEAVDQLLDEKNAGEDAGTVDLLWLNGENFATGADAGLWFGPWAERLPNAKYIDWENPSISRDFGYPVEGREAPWGTAQFVMMYDSAKVDAPPKDMDELLAWTKNNPGRFTYPAPPDFTGSAFIEQVLYGVTGEIDRYQEPFDEQVFDRTAPEVYDFLNEIEPYLWRKGETYPQSSTLLDELYQNGEIYLSMSYDPQFAQQQVDEDLFATGTRTYVLDGGTLSNTHYVAIPFNSTNKAGAQVVANFLESPEAQMEKQDPGVWGDLTVLSVDRLPEDMQAKLTEPAGEATLSVRELQENQVPEARSEWLLKLREGWPENVRKE